MDHCSTGQGAPRGQTDPLTGLTGRRAFLEMLARRAAPEGLGILAADLDGLGQINRTFGYLRGDEYIALAARRLSDLFSDRGELFRADGGTFALVLPAGGTRPEALAEQIQGAAVRAEGGQALSLTAGWAEYTAGTDRNLKDTWDRACRAMRARKAGAAG